MATALVGPFISKLAVTPLASEVKLAWDIHSKAKSLIGELEQIEALLKDADDLKIEERKIESASLRTWMKHIRDATIISENAIDKYRYYVRKNKQFKLIDLIRNPARAYENFKMRYQAASKMQKANLSLRDIKKRGRDIGLRPLEQGASSIEEPVDMDHLIGSNYTDDDKLVGIESAKRELIAKLVQGPSERLVVSLVGEGGIGKTTLAKQVYNDGAVKSHFESAAWITVSQSYNLKNILDNLKETICGKEEVNGINVIDCLKKYLKTKRYVIVFDDVWKEKFWDDIQNAFPDNQEGSRIIITTRSSEVSDPCKNPPNYVKTLQPWSFDLAWEFFHQKAFRGGCPKDFKVLSEKIVKKCQGLPLVIASIAGLLSTKTELSEWEKMLDDLKSNTENYSRLAIVQKILSFSYYDLPHPVRPCFLYFSLFPEDYSISDDRLCRLWIAEGFAKAKGNKSSEEVAEEYLDVLIKRNLISFDRWLGVGGGNYFRVHDLFHQFILSRAEELCFCRIWDPEKLEFRGNGRRLMISGDAKAALEKVESSGVRSLFLSDIDDTQLTDSFMIALFKKFKFLEVLDVESCELKELPEELEKMLFLKYLSLWKTELRSLPKSIKKLQDLYSLDTRRTLIKELPKEIKELKNLRHILAYSYSEKSRSKSDHYLGVKLPEGCGQLQDLQTLTAVDVHQGGANIINELEKLTKLRWLHITTLSTELGGTAIAKMNRLQRLYIASPDHNNVMDLRHISSLLLLRDLTLDGRLVCFPEWILNLQNLQALCLASSGLTDYQSFKSLKCLKRLETLKLGWNAYTGEELHFEEGYMKLKSLHVYNFSNIKTVKIERGAFPILNTLLFTDCPLLKELPSIEHLTNIKYAVLNRRRI
jgi:disease resistance protein RPM1